MSDDRDSDAIGISPKLLNWIGENAGVEIYADVLIPGHGLTKDESVPKQDLETLVREWNTREYHLGEAQKERFDELQKCRKELEELLEDNA